MSEYDTLRQPCGPACVKHHRRILNLRVITQKKLLRLKPISPLMRLPPVGILSLLLLLQPPVPQPQVPLPKYLSLKETTAKI